MKLPKGCIHPNCLNCPLKDCKMDKGMKESAEINKILKKIIKIQRGEENEM